MLYPNPAQDHVNLHMVSDMNGIVKINIYNVLHFIVFTEEIGKQSPSLDLSMVTSQLARGTYFVEVTVGGKQWKTLKLVKQ